MGPPPLFLMPPEITEPAKSDRLTADAPSFLLPDVCTAAANEENGAIGLENGHSHCAHRPVQHSKVGGATLMRHRECFTYPCGKSPPKTFGTGRPGKKITLKVIG